MFVLVSLIRNPLCPKESFKLVPGPTVMMLISAFSLNVIPCPKPVEAVSAIKYMQQLLIKWFKILNVDVKLINFQLNKPRVHCFSEKHSNLVLMRKHWSIGRHFDHQYR
jgi:hypothetical protein